MPSTQSLPERVLREDLEAAAFLGGVDRGYWRLVSIAFPHAVFEISAAPRPNTAAWLGLRFDISQYPTGVSAQPWDVEHEQPLASILWPAGNERIERIFNPGWMTNALYFPLDSVAMQGHPNWPNETGFQAWDPTKGIAQYLTAVHALINEETYRGARG